MTNEPERSVEEIVEQVRDFIPIEVMGFDEIDKLENWLTQTLNTVREEERDKILEMIGHLPYVSQEEHTKYKNGGVIKWVTLKEHLTATP